MSVIKAVLREMFGLFVDDGRFALSILAWVAIVWLGAARLGLPSSSMAVLLFVGLAAILVESAVRRARK